MKYEMVSGLETHVELSTKTKIFCGCVTDFGGAPNTHCCPVCTGQPGALPILNKTVVEYAVRAGLATHCKINEITHMDRKNYCYPDLPKAYQISQFDEPVCEHGYITLDSGKRIGITRIHIEEDAGKLVHEGGYTYIDYNRGGVPLIEIVSEPDISSPAEAREYIEKLQLIMRYAGVSDCKMQEGSMRCDVNISIRKPGDPFGTRTEIKNMNSVSFIERAMQYEYERQADILDNGGKVEQETLHFNESDGTTSSMRGKEDAQDYRYFPEPDILTVHIPAEKIAEVANSLPKMPDERLAQYVNEWGLSAVNAKQIVKYIRVADFFEYAAAKSSPKTACNLLVGVIFASLNTEEEKEAFEITVSAEELGKLAKLQDDGKISGNLAQKTLKEMLRGTGKVDDVLKAEDLQAFPEEELKKLCRGAIDANSKAVADYLNGKEAALNALFGFVMKGSRGKADPARAREIIKEMLR